MKSSRQLCSVVLLSLICFAAAAQSQSSGPNRKNPTTPSTSKAANGQQADWKSLDARSVPEWWLDAKFGIFIHWGVYSVPAWCDGWYAEWYYFLINKQKPGQGVRKHHIDTYGRGFKYPQFAPQFRAERYDPKGWARLFDEAGAKYVVLTSKHHDGFCLWNAPDSEGWNAVDVGPGKDLIDPLAKAVRAQGLRFGLYISLLEWDFGDELPGNKYDLADGSTVTYSWYRFIDQPSFQQYNWSEEKKAKLQSFVEKIHANWPIDRDYMAPLSSGKLAAFDPALLVTPPDGMEVGYVPIVTHQEDTNYRKNRSEIRHPSRRIVFIDEDRLSPGSWTAYYDEARWWVQRGAWGKLGYGE